MGRCRAVFAERLRCELDVGHEGEHVTGGNRVVWRPCMSRCVRCGRIADVPSFGEMAGWCGLCHRDAQGRWVYTSCVRPVDREERVCRIGLPHCVKCGGVDIRLRWHGAGHRNLYPPHECPDVGEHLHYHCRRCGYAWTGPTRDAHHNPTASAAHEGDFIGGE